MDSVGRQRKMDPSVIQSSRLMKLYFFFFIEINILVINDMLETYVENMSNIIAKYGKIFI